MSVWIPRLWQNASVCLPEMSRGSLITSIPQETALKALLRWWVKTPQTRTPAVRREVLGSVSPRGPGGSAAGCAPRCPAAFPSCCRAGAGRKLSGACLLFILATRCCSSAVARRPKFNAQMTPPSSLCAQRPLRMRDCTTELRWEYNYFSVLICFVWSTAAEGWDLAFLWRGPQRTLRGRSFCCCATIRAHCCPSAPLWSPAQIWRWDYRSAGGVSFSLLPLRVSTKKRAAVWKAHRFCFCAFRAHSGDNIFSFI